MSMLHRLARDSLGVTFGALAVVVLKGCIFSRSEIAFSVTIPEAVKANAKWIEVAAYPERCPSAEELAGPLPNAGMQARVAMSVDEKKPPAFGRLPKGRYGFAASIRNSQCGVLAAGCTVAELPGQSSVDIALGPLSTSAGTCEDGITCAYAQCVPAVNSGDPSAGRACSMRLVGAGPLSAPVADDVQISPPSVAITNDGFLIAYREYSSLSAQAALTIVPIDQGGGIGTLHGYGLKERCAGLDENDGISLSFSKDEGKGLVAISRKACKGGGSATVPGGLELYAIENDGSASSSAFTASKEGSDIITLTGHALALASGSKQILAFGLNDGTRVAEVDRATLSFTAAAGVDYATPATSASVVRSSSALALLATSPSSVVGADAATQDSVIALTLTNATTPFDKLPKAITSTGTFGSLAMQDGRLFVVRQSSIPGRAADFDAYDVGSTTPVASDSLSTSIGIGETTAIDVALAQNRAFFAVGQPKSVTVLVYDHATTNPSFLREVHLPSDPRIPTFVGKFRDGGVAIAATDTRVIVAWTTGKTLEKNDVLGGYAVFACTNP